MDEFVKKVAEMRRLQKLYFSSRDSFTLQACKKIEREVDTLLEYGKTPASTKSDAKQASLFEK